nr:hypothetical protein [Tanacetum cinerariifolium]
MPEDLYAYVVAAFQALPPPDYVPGPKEPEQAPPSPIYIHYVPELVYPEYIPPEDDVLPPEEQPLSDPEDDDDEDPKEDPADYPADQEEPSGDDADEEDEEQDEDDDNEEEEHPTSADSIPPPPALRGFGYAYSPTISTYSIIISITTNTISPTPSITPILPIPLPAASPPLQLLSSDRKADRPEVTLPPRKRLNIVHCPGYEAGESLVATAARPMEGRRADYRFVDSVEAEIRRRRAEDIGYGIRDTWIDLRDVVEEDTQDIYGVMEDTLGRQTEIFQRVEALVDDSQYHYETGRLVDQEARCSREAWAHSIGLSSAAREQARAGALEGAGSST